MNEYPIPAKDPNAPANPFWVQVLTESIQFLWDGSNPSGPWPEGKRKYICYCLSMAFLRLTDGMREEEDEYIRLEVQLEELKHEITQKLGSTFYEDYLLSRFPLPYPLDGNFYLKVQAARLRWIHQLIEEFGG